ncbi:MAG: hypothetical protein IPK85_03365 [Gemmatimonadetes bacterium]|nr:hypothetical protein [Gemmatimonadota bacterium]
MRKGYVITLEEDGYLATSTDMGVGAVDKCPVRALAECRVKERNSRVRPMPVDAHLPLKEAVELGCQMLGVTYLAVADFGRHHEVVVRRAILYWLLWHRGNGWYRVFSAPEIARACGKTNHSTIIGAANRCIPLTRLAEWEVLEAVWAKAIADRKAERIDWQDWFQSLIQRMPLHKGTA